MLRHSFKGSTAIASLLYDEEREVLQVTFANGRSYTLDNVPRNTVEEFMNSDSPGRFFNTSLKGMF